MVITVCFNQHEKILTPCKSFRHQIRTSFLPFRPYFQKRKLVTIFLAFLLTTQRKHYKMLSEIVNLILHYLGGNNLNELNIIPSADSDIAFDAIALGNTIRLLRERLKLTQADLGNLSSLSSAEISKLESGMRKKIPLNTLIKIIPHLNVSLDYVLASCLNNSRNDSERFFDYEGKEIDLYKIAKNLYSVDSGLLLMLSSNDFLSDAESILFIKNWLKLRTAINKISHTSSILNKIFTDFTNYCFNFIKTMFGFLDEQADNLNNKA